MAGSGRPHKWNGYLLQVRPANWWRRGLPLGPLQWIKWPFFVDSNHPSFELLVTNSEGGPAIPEVPLSFHLPGTDDEHFHRAVNVSTVQPGETRKFPLGEVISPTTGHVRIRLDLADHHVPGASGSWETLYWYSVHAEEKIWSVFWGALLAIGVVILAGTCFSPSVTVNLPSTTQTSTSIAPQQSVPERVAPRSTALP
jgi:hypothetical protein